LTFLVLTDDTQKVIKRSVLRLANGPENEMRLDKNNLRVNKAACKEPQRKVNFTTAGRDPCLADGFIELVLQLKMESQLHLCFEGPIFKLAINKKDESTLVAPIVLTETDSWIHSRGNICWSNVSLQLEMKLHVVLFL